MKEINLKNILLNILFAVCITTSVIGVSIAAYPFTSRFFSDKTVSATVSHIHKVSAQTDSSERSKLLAEAKEYNKSLSDPTIKNTADYLNILNIDETGAIGSIRIPSLDLTLPIFHGTEETTLRRGVGHLRNTAFPIGEIGTHTVLTGHSGLPEARLFSDLDQLSSGDTFDITVLSETTRYKVISIAVVRPSDVNRITPIHNKCLASLVTCTPVRINSHRLIVTAEKIGIVPIESETADTETESDISDATQPLQRLIVSFGLSALIYLIIIVIALIITNKQERSR